MRTNRRQNREQRKNKMKQYHLLFFVVLPISALVIGYFIANFMIIPIFLR